MTSGACLVAPLERDPQLGPGRDPLGVELDRKLAALLEALRVEVPMALLSSTSPSEAS